MTEMKMHDQVFPFKCNNPDCVEEYDLELFTEVILLWGYIYLISEDDKVAILGLTCPSCTKTTVRKYTYDVALLAYDKLKKHSNFQLNQYVHFSYSLLKQWDLIDSEYTKNEKKHPFFFVPQETQQMMQTVGQQFSANERDILFYCKIENEQQFKAIPRIVPFQSIYFILDMIFQDKIYFDLNETLIHLIKPNSDNQSNILTKRFCNLIANDLNEEQYNKMDLDLFAYERKSFKNNIQQFINEAKCIRNKIDCEIVYRNELINKYARKMYFDPVATAVKKYESTEALEVFFETDSTNDDIVSADTAPMSFLSQDLNKNVLDQKPVSFTIKSTVSIKLISGDKLMQRWALDGFDLINLALSHNVPALDILGRKELTEEILNQKDFVELLSGNMEEQKKALRRLRFEPEKISVFEKDNPDLLEEFGISNKNISKAPAIGKEKKLRLNQLHKIEVRKIAKKLWEQYPDKTIADMIFKDEINNVFSEREKGYTDKTLREWINDLCPNRKPGRRKN